MYLFVQVDTSLTSHFKQLSIRYKYPSLTVKVELILLTDWVEYLLRFDLALLLGAVYLSGVGFLFVKLPEATKSFILIALRIKQ